MTEPIRASVSDAAGRISYSLLFRIAAGGLFGLDQPVRFGLLDVLESQPLLEANRLELFDCAFPLLAGVEIGDDPCVVFRNANWVILLGGIPQSYEGQKRHELIRLNGLIFRPLDRDSRRPRRLRCSSDDCLSMIEPRRRLDFDALPPISRRFSSAPRPVPTEFVPHPRIRTQGP